MLKWMRTHKAQKQIYWFLAIIVTSSFVLTGVFFFAPDESGAPTVLGAIGKRKVGLRDYLASYKAAQRQAQLAYGDRYQAMRGHMDFRRDAWDRLLLLEEAKKRNFKTSDQEVFDWIAAQPGFGGPSGFNFDYYRRYVKEGLRAEPKEFESEIRQMLTIAKLVSAIRKESEPNEEAAKNAYASRGGRGLVYGVLDAKPFEATVQVEDKDIESIYPLVQDKLTAPDRVNVKFLFIPKSDEETKKAALEDSSPLEEIAKKHSLETKETGPFSKSEAAPGITSFEALSQAFSLPEGEESVWIRASAGSYKLRVTKRESGRVLTKEESLETLSSMLKRDKAREEAIKKLESLRERFEKEGFEKTLEAEKIPFQRMERYRDNDEVPGIGATPELKKALEGLELNKPSKVIPSETGAAVLMVTKVWPFDAAAFEKDKAEFQRTFSEETAEKKLDELLTSLRKDLKIDHVALAKIFGEQ